MPRRPLHKRWKVQARGYPDMAKLAEAGNDLDLAGCGARW